MLRYEIYKSTYYYFFNSFNYCISKSFYKDIEYKLKKNFLSLSILWVLNSNQFDPISICSIQCKDMYIVHCYKNNSKYLLYSVINCAHTQKDHLFCFLRCLILNVLSIALFAKRTSIVKNLMNPRIGRCI